MKHLLVLASPLIISCTAINPDGGYVYGPWVENTYIEHSPDNTFWGRLWSDDGLDQCKAYGTWEFDLESKVLITKVKRRENLSDYWTVDECATMIAGNQTWNICRTGLKNSRGILYNQVARLDRRR